MHFTTAAMPNPGLKPRALTRVRGRGWTGLMRQLLVVLLMVVPTSAHAEEGWFGFSQRVEVGWLLNVESAIVNFVAKGSPAENAGIVVGDAFVSIDDCAIPGCGAYKAEKLMTKKIGESLRLTLKRQNGEEYTATLVAAAPPRK